MIGKCVSILLCGLKRQRHHFVELGLIMVHAVLPPSSNNKAPCGDLRLMDTKKTVCKLKLIWNVAVFVFGLAPNADEAGTLHQPIHDIVADLGWTKSVNLLGHISTRNGLTHRPKVNVCKF